VAFYQLPEVSSLLRAGMIIAGLVAAAAVAYNTVPGKETWSFAVGARNEVRKVIWPTRKETMQSTLVVIVMVILVGLYIWILDSLSFWVIYDLLLSVGA
jgi:preprotein translocase subunit SecE